MLTEKLILLVRERQLLYDLNHIDHNDKVKVRKAWLEINKEMGTENNQHWAKKWRNLRYYYKKFKKRTGSSPEVTPKRNNKFTWTEQLTFLDDYEIINLKQSNNMNIRTESVNTSDTKETCENISKGDSEKVLRYLRRNNLRKTKSCDICHLFQRYATFLKDMPIRMQRSLKQDLATMFAKYQSRILRSYGAIISLPKSAPQNTTLYANKSPKSLSNETLQTSEASGVTLNSQHDSVFQQSMQQIDIINSATTTPISLLVQSLVKQLCSLLEKDNIRANQLYNTICEKLHSMNLIDDSYAMGEFEAMRSQYQRALYQLVAVANGSEIPINLPAAWPIVQPSGLEWSRYHREFEELFFIAGGGFGSVFKARHRLDGVEYAVKKVFIKSSDVNSIMLHLSEVKTIASLNHPNIVNYKAAWLEPMIESKIKKKSRFKMETDSVDFDSNIISSVHPNFINSFKTHNSRDLTKNKSLSDLVISFEHSGSCELNLDQNDSSDSIDYLEDSDEESISPDEENAVANYFTGQEYENCSRVNLKWATLYIQMTYCPQTLTQWLDNRNRHMTVSRKNSEDFTLHHSESTESAFLDSPDVTYPIDWTHLDVLIDMFTQLVKGLHYIHSRGIIHHDIKPSNVFVAKSEGGCTVQLGDFGLACPLQQSHTGLALGTHLYAAPEQLEGECNPKSDMYSLGIILLEMVEPFSTAMERVKTITDLRKGQIPAHLIANYPKIAHIIGRLVHRRPGKRFDTVQLLEEVKNLGVNKDETIKTLKEELAAKADELAAKDDEIAAKDEELAAKNNEIAKLKMVLAKLNYQ